MREGLQTLLYFIKNCYIFLTNLVIYFSLFSRRFLLKNHIREYRTKLGLTQEELAHAVDVRRETILHMEQGKYNPSLRLAYLTAKKLGTTIQQLFIFDEEH